MLAAPLVKMVAVEAIRVSIEEPALRSVSPQVFGTTALVPELFVGKHCENWLRRSCQNYKAAGSYSSCNQAFRVLCDFHSEPGFAWNVIE